MVLIPFVVLDVLLFAITALQHGISAAWNGVKQLAIPEIGVWLIIALAMLLERRVSNRFTAVQDEIEELKERISHLETHK